MLEEHQTAQPRILAIDDSIFIHRLLKARLQGEGVEITCIDSAQKGIDTAIATLPDVILVDLEFPEMSGFEVLQALKNCDATNQIPVIILSGSQRTDDKVRGLELGAVDFISKPFDVPELKARIRSALRIVNLVRLLAQRASLDGLTGLGNRAFFDKRLASELSEAVRHSQPISLVMADIDHFKSINDRFGHPFGDRVIETFSQILSTGRLSDIPCRYGGEEFAVLLPNTTADEAQTVATRARSLMEARTWSGQPGLKVTASFGVADLEGIGHTDRPMALVEAADQALYAAKKGGRNRVVVAGHIEVPAAA